MNAAECKKYCHKSISIGIGNTFCQSIVIGIGNSSYKSQVLLTSLCLNTPYCVLHMYLWSILTNHFAK